MRSPRPPFDPLAFAGAITLLASSSGCASIPSGARAVDSVDVAGNRTLASSDIEGKIATSESPRFLMLFQGLVYDYELFDRYVLEKDLERVEAFYRANGFYDARARAGRVEYVGKRHVRVTIVVEEGQATLVREVAIRGLEGLPADVVSAAVAASVAKLHKGARFNDDDYASTEDAVKRALTDHGYAYARTSRRAEVDLAGHYATASYDVAPGPPARFGAVTIEGLGTLPEKPVRRALDIGPGERYSTAKIDAAKQAILDLGVFGNVTIVPTLPEPPPPDAIVPLAVKVEPSKIHQLTLGAGVEFDPIKTDLHAIVGWESHDFLGDLRNFHVEVKPGVVLYPLRMQTPFDAPTNLLPEEKARAVLRQPGFLEARTNGVLRSDVNTYPVLLTPQQSGPGVPVLGYLEAKEAVGVERAFGKLYVSPTYDYQHDQPFPYLGAMDPTLGPINLSYVDLSLKLDLRDDHLHPHSGVYLLNDLQVAGLGGDAADIREQPDARAYIPLGKRVTWGWRGSVGFLDPFDYGSTLGNPTAQADDRAAWAKDSQLVYLRGFFSGGPTSNRGYPLYGVGPHGAVPFFNPQIAANQIAQSCEANNPTFDASRCAVPLGGFTLWEASTEVRVALGGPLEAAFFCDASDVEQHQAQFRLDTASRYHVSCGGGARYDTPVGPIRVDVGYRLPGLNPNFSDPNVVATDGDPGTILGAPIAIDLGIGESF
jgi:outer membrane protein insertion porin family/translocation and assembly module TamA